MASIDPNAGGSGAGDVSPTGSSSATNPKMRKRTKTGCLTCRKRRIKCGEERPTCANCIKSKRQCEGYNQRVVFKPPIGDWPNHPGVVMQYHNSMLPGTRSAGGRPNQSPPQSQEGTLTSIQPRPLTQFEYHAEAGPTLGHLHTQQGYGGTAQPYGQDRNYEQPLHSPHHQSLHSPHHQLPTPTSATSYFSQPSPIHAGFPGHYAQEANVGYQETQRYPVASQDHAYYQQQQATSHPEHQSSYPPQSNTSPHTEAYPTQYAEHRPSVHHYDGHALQAGPYGLTDISHSSYQSVQIPQHAVTSDVKYPVYEKSVTVSQVQQENEPRLALSGFGGEDHISPTQVLDEAAVEGVDDDYWDVHSDEEMLDAVDPREEDAVILGRDFSLIRRIHLENTNELAMRRYDAFIYEGVLTHYKAEQVANPLKNPKTARVFAHFIHVTGPSLSIYDRNPRNPTSIFEGPTPPSQQSLWTYRLPLKALTNQGLLHAMLALASLHIAKLQRASVTPSYKHYAYALKRLSRSLGNPKRRNAVATLATSILLAYYEVMTAEHVKWSTHLVGGAQLLTELDFPSLTQEARRLKAAHAAHESRFAYQNLDMLIDQKQMDQELKANVMMPDEHLVSTIVGKKVSFDDFGKVFEDAEGRHGRRNIKPGKLDLRTYETLQDLYWYYARMDAFQSMVSGNPLITHFSKWSDCPPRAPLGRADALYGTHDHIILLIARISDFTVRDRERKLKQQAADGGQWRPRPGMPGGMPTGPPSSKGPGGQPPTPTTPMGPPPHFKGMGPPGFGPPPGHERRQGQSAGPAPPQGPPRGPPPGGAGPNFFGMAPSRPHGPLTSSYAGPEYHSHEAPPTPTDSIPTYTDLGAAYEAALAEWNSMSHAHAIIARFLANTDTFAALTPEHYPVAPGGNMTPFGPALVHRSYDISSLWSMLHLSNILLLRAHPTMPPAAMVAAGVCAQATQPYAMLIGRISAGMQIPASADVPLSPFLGAALIESTMALFFAGVQYQAPDQRKWLVKRLLDIDRRTGWATAGVICRSVETSWEKAAEMKRGPPYPNRKTRPFGQDGPIALDAEGPSGGVAEGGWGGGAVMRDQARMSAGGVGGGDQRFVVSRMGSGRVPWAKNVLATEEDLRREMERVGLSGS